MDSIGRFWIQGSLWSIVRSVRFSSSDKTILELISSHHGTPELKSADEITPELVTMDLMNPKVVFKNPNHSRAQLNRFNDSKAGSY